MLVDYTYRPKKITREINALVGAPFSLKWRVKLRGIGSHRMQIEQASHHIAAKLSQSSDLQFGSIELRPEGILIHFKDNLTHWIWAIPYYRLVIYDTQYDSIHAAGHSIHFKKEYLKRNNKRFFTKLGRLKAEYTEEHFSAGPNPEV